MSAKKSRRRLFVDWEVQGALIGRFLLYWSICLFTVLGALIFPDYLFKSSGIFGPDSGFWLRYGPALVLAVLLTLPMLLDLLQSTNRFAGPMVRTRRFLRSLAKGEDVEPIAFRNNDFWRGYADDLNAILHRIQKPVDKRSSVTSDDGDEISRKDENAEEKDSHLAHSA